MRSDWADCARTPLKRSGRNPCFQVSVASGATAAAAEAMSRRPSAVERIPAPASSYPAARGKNAGRSGAGFATAAERVSQTETEKERELLMMAARRPIINCHKPSNGAEAEREARIA